MTLRPNELRGSFRMSWRPLGRARIDSAGKIEFPKMPTKPGLYRFVITKSNGAEAEYIGETDNLQRRLAHYRNPGPTQATNLRLNALFKQLLVEGAQIEICAVIEEAWISWNESERSADFGSKNVRRLFESFALAAERSVEVESLNK